MIIESIIEKMKWIIRVIIKLFSGMFISIVGICIFLYLLSWTRENYMPQDIAPESGQFIQTQDISLFVQTAGNPENPSVLFLHGTGSWSEIWRESMDYLVKSGFYVIAVDLPPFGYSGKPTGVANYSREKQAQRLIDVLDGLSIDKVNLVAHSVGSRPAVEAALTKGERLHSLVLVAPALGFPTDKSIRFEQNSPSFLMRGLFSFPLIRDTSIAASSTNTLLTKKFFEAFVYKKESITENRVRMIQKPLALKNMTTGQADWFEYLLIEQDNSKSSNMQTLAKLNIPTAIISGARDSITPLWQGEALNKLIPDSRLIIMNEVGHIPYIEAPEEFNELLVDFLIQISKQN